MRSLRKGCRAGTVYLRRGRFKEGRSLISHFDLHTSDGKEPFEERSIAFQGDTQVFGRDFATLAPLRLELGAFRAEGIRQSFHHLADESIRLFDCSSRLIDKPGLNRIPPCAEPAAFLVMKERHGLVRGLHRTSGTPFSFYWDAFVHDALRNAPSSVFNRSSNS